ncbi:hypothetical protein C8R44DRAFT_736379 [Mycena epipterygia]|nr:hypothetical protein C8R44DRAFT_736379 [Mycena epipterygia]
MSEVIVILLGLRSVGEILSKAARRVNSDAGGCEKIHVVEYYYPRGAKHQARLSKPPQQATLVELETALKKQIEKITGASFDPSNVGDILFAYSNKKGESTGFPFDKDTCFLGFQGPALFRKLLVVHSSCDNDLKREWNDLIKAGMRVTAFDGKPDSAGSIACQILANSAAVSEPQRVPMESPCSSTLTLAEDGPTGDRAAPMDHPHRRYTDAARATGRHPDQAVILLLGHSGHGKSKTINRLLGQNLLTVGRTTLGSTTKDIQRVQVPVYYNPDTKVNVTLAFDDTPGDADTVQSDRTKNSSLVQIYKEQYFPDTIPSDSLGVRHKTYPNIILLITSWDTITIDAHNPPDKFTSPVGISMYKLSSSGLVDDARTNVVVVVTKSMSSWNQFDDFETTAEKNIQWNIEAGRRRGIITDLQRKVFPKLAAWHTVFVENGGGVNMGTEYPILPNGELSHQNLFEAIRGVIEAPGPDGTCDLAGMHALDVLTGVKLLNLASQAETTTLVRRPPEPAIDIVLIPIIQHSVPPPVKLLNLASQAETTTLVRKPPESAIDIRVRQLAERYLGVAYNPILTQFGSSCILSMESKDIKYINGCGRHSEQFTQVVDTHEMRRTVASRLHLDAEVPHIAGFSGHYSSSKAFLSSQLTDSQIYTSEHLTTEVWVDILDLHISDKMRCVISRLPPWSEESKQQYYEFFSNHGTHFVLRLALGGNLRIVVDDQQASNDFGGKNKIGTKGKAPVLQNIINIGGGGDRLKDIGAGDFSGKRNSKVFLDGGSSVANELTITLEDHFKRKRDKYDWPKTDVRAKWVKALEHDPAFCPDNESTQYRWIYTLGGLRDDQVSDLRLASKDYIQTQHKENPSVPPQLPGTHAKLPRVENFRHLRRAWRKIFPGRAN